MKKIAIDFGSGVTKLYIPGCGVVLTEATCIAVEKNVGESLRIKAYGDKARALFGRAAQNTHIVNPVFEGKIINENLAVILLKYFLEKVEITPRKAKRTEAIFLIPCGVKPEDKNGYERVAAECGFAAVYFVQVPIAAVMGQNVAIGESVPVFALDIGCSMTNIAAFSQDGIIAGLSINLGGGNIDLQLMDALAENFNLKIGNLTAEKLKNKVGSLLDDDNKMTVVDGRSVEGGAPASVAISSGQIYDLITAYIDKIIEYVELVLNKLPPEAASVIMHSGIYLSGGLFNMDGLADYISKKLNVPVNLSEEPRLCAVIGAGAIIADDGLLDKFATA